MDGNRWPDAVKFECVYCKGLKVKSKRFENWKKTANTKVENTHFHNAANPKASYLIPDLDHSGCINCTFICKSVSKKGKGIDYIYDSYPGLRAVINQRNERHLMYSSGDGSNQGRIPSQYRPMWCDVGEWGYNKRLSEYTEESNQKFKKNITKDLKLSDKDREFIDYYKNRIQTVGTAEIYKRETQDYYKYNAIRKKLRTYYKHHVTIERSACKACHAGHAYILFEDKSTLGKWHGPIDKYPTPLYSIAGIYERSKERQPHPAGLQVFDEDYETVEDEYGEYGIEGPGELVSRQTSNAG
jgi:hypothetical protein